METQRRDGVNDRLRILVEIGDDDGDAAPMQEILKVLERLCKIRARPWLGPLQPGESRASCPCRVDGRM